jgi:pyruvate dehydrogenase E2 component (dihydrolipoamide acetyltransferase)
MPEIAMPRLSDSMEEGVVLKWMKGVGDEVAVGEELVEIETDKANMAYESDVAGKLTEILAQEGDALPVGAPIAVVGEREGGGAPVPEAKPAPAPVPAPAPRSAPAGATGSTQSTEVKASPVAKRIAKEKGIDLATIVGTGPGGRIVKKDVEAADRTPTPATPAPPATDPTETAKGAVDIRELTKLQQVVARRMSESKATAPHFYLTSEVDMSAAVTARARIKAHLAAEGEVVPSFNDMVVKACALALRKFPIANGSYKDGRFELYSRINVGIAVAADDALVVPTIFDADRKGLREIAADARSLAGKVRDGSITPPELSGGTFSVSNLGMYGIKSFGAIVNSPQAGILAVGEIADRPVVRDGQVVPGKVMEMTLSCDHRILYGADGAEFLAEVKGLLEEPVALAL